MPNRLVTACSPRSLPSLVLISSMYHLFPLFAIIYCTFTKIRRFSICSSSTTLSSMQTRTKSGVHKPERVGCLSTTSSSICHRVIFPGSITRSQVAASHVCRIPGIEAFQHLGVLSYILIICMFWESSRGG